MNKKQNTIKIVSSIFVFIFLVFFSQSFLPHQVKAAKLDWSNPNKNGKNPYKITTDAVLNSQTMMQVVGCTGLVDKISGYATDYAKKLAVNILTGKKYKDYLEEQRVKACEAAKKSTAFSVAGLWNTTFTTAVVGSVNCKEVNKTIDEENLTAAEKLQKSTEAAKKREECFNGLAYTLAKNQLTSMTRETINWINTGFNGDPMYVRSITSLTNSIERNVLETGVQNFAGEAFPFGRDFSEAIVKNYRTNGVENGTYRFLDNLTSDLSAFITDKDSYGIGKYGPEGMTKLEIAQEANDRFANDFSTGGWDGYLALTQRDQNNPLGFTMLATQYLADRIDQQSNESKDETLMGGGFMSQKTCIKWQQYDEEGHPEIVYENVEEGALSKRQFVYSKDKRPDSNDKCIQYNVVTPGSIIKDKLLVYINSGERQLELADTINKALNNLFTNLIQNFRNEGLFGLSSEKYEYDGDLNMGFGYGSNSYDSVWSDEEKTSYAGYDGGYNGSFDLTRDLGNTYNHEKTTSLGTWDAKRNIPELNINLGPYDSINKTYHPANVYYTVSSPGYTKLFNDGYNGWARGDRAFWNGKEWQNWKAGQTSPIVKRGILQIQKDYSVAAKEILKKLPGVMPKIGELDYCIPGPNPNFRINSENTADNFRNLVESITIRPVDQESENMSYSIDPTGLVYKEYSKFYKEPEILSYIVNVINSSVPWKSFYQFNVSPYIFENGESSTDEDWAIKKMGQHIEWFTQQTETDIENFYNKYSEKILDGIYNKILPEFIEREDRAEIIKNTSYVPMAKDGYSITRKMAQYDEDISYQREDYLSSVIQAEENTVKLTAIKNEVSRIIKEAQSRRDEKLLIILQEETIKKCEEKKDACLIDGTGLPLGVPSALFPKMCNEKYEACIKNTITEAEYKEKYASCFEEEDILYYDDVDIMNDYEGESGRCFDELDNDLDGLIDSKDPDCAGAGATPPTTSTNFNVSSMGCTFNGSVSIDSSSYNINSTITASATGSGGCSVPPFTASGWGVRASQDGGATWKDIFSSNGGGPGYVTFTAPSYGGTGTILFQEILSITGGSGTNNTATGSSSLSYSVTGGSGGGAGAFNPTPPTIENPVIVFVTPTAVALQAQVTGAGMTNNSTSATITERGFCYFKQSQSPSSEICVPHPGTPSVGTFEISPISNTLTPNTPYHWYGYVKNSAGLRSVSWSTFITPAT